MELAPDIQSLILPPTVVSVAWIEPYELKPSQNQNKRFKNDLSLTSSTAASLSQLLSRDVFAVLLRARSFI